MKQENIQEDNDQDNGNKEIVTQCPECFSGKMHQRFLTYFTWLNNELITVPNFPAWVCDLCGRRDYDTRAIKWLNIMLNPETGQRRSHKRQIPVERKPRQKNKPAFPE